MSLSTFRFAHTDLRKGVTGVCQDSLSRRVVVYRSRKLYPPWNYILRWIQVRKQGEALFPWRVGDYVRVTTWELGGGDKPEIFGGRVYWSWRIESTEHREGNHEYSSFHREARKWGGGSSYDTEAVGGKYNLRRFRFKQGDLVKKRSKENICLSLETYKLTKRKKKF